MGKIIFKRTKYECTNKNCSENIYPLDKGLDINNTSLSKGLGKVISLYSIFVPFDHVNKFISDTLNLQISVTCIKDLSYRIGNMISSSFTDDNVDMDEEDENIDVLYMQADGAMVPILTENGLEYKENKLALAFTDKDMEKKVSKKGKESIKIKNRRFVSSIGEGAETFKKLVQKLALKKGMLKAKTVVLLSDGATWISKMKDDYLSGTIQILDWYHAIEHLWDTAHSLFGDDKSKCLQWVKPLKQKLWDGQIDEVLTIIKNKAYKSSKKRQTPLFELHTYYFNNKNNMHYADYRKKGYYIGSTAIESANKYIVGQRLKQAGMRWRLHSANAMIWLRCKYFEGTWDQFWDKTSFRDIMAPLQLKEA